MVLPERCSSVRAGWPGTLLAEEHKGLAVVGCRSPDLHGVHAISACQQGAWHTYMDILFTCIQAGEREQAGRLASGCAAAADLGWQERGTWEKMKISLGAFLSGVFVLWSLSLPDSGTQFLFQPWTLLVLCDHMLHLAIARNCTVVLYATGYLPKPCCYQGGCNADVVALPYKMACVCHNELITKTSKKTADGDATQQKLQNHKSSKTGHE